MKQPIIQIDLNEHGQIEQIYGDLRLYVAFSGQHSAPPLSTLLALREPANIYPDGSPAQDGPTDAQPLIWHVDVLGEAIVRLRDAQRNIEVDLRISPETERSNPKYEQLLISIIFRDKTDHFDNLLLAVCGQDDLRQCLTNFLHRQEDFAFLNDVATVVESIRALRHQREQFFMTLMNTPMTIDSDPTEEGNDDEADETAGDCVVCSSVISTGAGTETRCGEGWAHDEDCLQEHARTCSYCSDPINDPVSILTYRIVRTEEYPQYANMEKSVLERAMQHIAEGETQDARLLLEALLKIPTISTHLEIKDRAAACLANLN